MRFRDLGPFRVEIDELDVAVPGGRLNAVLAVLVANVGYVVPTPAIVEAVWGDHPPARASGSLDSLLWRLRKILEPGQPARKANNVLRTEPGGYRIAVDPQDVDSATATAAAAHLPQLIDSDPAEALELLDDTLARWRGEPFQDVPDAAWLPPFRLRMEDLHGDLEQRRTQLLLDGGQPERASAAAEAALRRHPFREKLWGHLMVGLYRSGRQAAALDAYRVAQRTLADELGIDPGPGLQQVHAQLLAQDRSLLTTADMGGAVIDLRPGNVPVRRRHRVFGREFELSALSELLTSERLVTVTGPVGVGKTALALAVAAESRQFPDGAVLVDLAAIPAGADVALAITITLGLTTGDTRDLHRALAYYYKGKRSLLVLDNCEHLTVSTAATVDALLTADTTVAVLATSREPLDVDGEQLFPLDPLPIPSITRSKVFGDEPAVQMFLNHLGLAHRHLEVADSDAHYIRSICESVDGLPLGIELAAARARAFTLAEVAASVAANPTALTRSGHGPARQTNLHDAIHANYTLCRPLEQELYQRLSVLPGPFSLAAATATAGHPPLTAAQIPDGLAGLVHRSMLTATQPRGGAPTMFRQLVPLRAHAASLLDTAEQQRTSAALDRWVEQLVAAGPRRGRTGQRDWYETLDNDYPTVAAALAHLLAAPDGDRGALTVSRMTGYWYDRNRGADALRWLDIASQHSGLTSFPAAAVAATQGAFLSIARDPAAAHDAIDRALPVLLAAGPAEFIEAAGLLVDLAAATWLGDDWALSVEIATMAAKRCAEAGDDATHERTIADTVIAAGQLFSGATDAGLATIGRVLGSGEDNGLALRFACAAAGVAALYGNDFAAGLHWSAEAIRHARRLGAFNIGESLEQRGLHLVNAARHDDAVRCFAAAAAQYTAVGLTWPRHDETPAQLDASRRVMSPAAFTVAWTAGQRLMAMELAADTDVDLLAWL